MQYNNISAATFLARPNRFVAVVNIAGREEVVHVKNTGRCRELLVPGATVYLEKSDNPQRRTAYDLVAVEKGDLLINMDAQAPNRVAEEWLKQQYASVQHEVRFGSSRFDFLVDGKLFIEVKGVTLERDGIAMFPDAPTERGVKHLRELVSAVAEGYRAAVLFVVQMKGCHCFVPNRATHPEFAEALQFAAAHGVEVWVRDCVVTPSELFISNSLPFSFDT